MIREEIEEAMNILKNYRSKEIKSVDEIYDEAVDTAIKILEKELDEAVEVDPAIKILEQEPSVDAISREAVLEVLKKNRYRFNISQEGYCEGKVLWSENLIKDDACKEIEQLPSVTPNEKTEWIRVRYEENSPGEYTYLSKMPNDKQEVLILNYNNEVRIDVCEKDNDHDIYTESGNDYAERVKAWMPLPKPYKEVSE